SSLLAFRDIPPSMSLQFRSLLAFTAVSLILGVLVTIYLLWNNREKIAILGIAVGMIPAGFCMISGVAQLAPYFSLAPAARYLNARLDATGQVIFEGSPGLASSLGFYLEGKFAMVNQQPDPDLPLTAEQHNLFLEESDALERWSATRAYLLFIEHSRVI